MARVGRAFKGALPGLLAGALLTAPLASRAADMAYLDVYYIVDSTLEFDLAAAPSTVESDDGDGAGVKLAAMLGESVFLAAEYQSSDNDFANASATNETSRIGLGYKTPWPVYVLAEYVNNSLEVDPSVANGVSGDEDGWAVHLGIKADLVKFVTLDARVGYLDVGESDGIEYIAGLGFNLDRNFGIFADYRVSELDNDRREASVEEVRAGLRFRF
ncbi:outer membrane beta-barrel protein [Sinimarinibacterium thermocellulolyticum]|uniref:Outer membrane beta-barrel protein n=1 Tax=Sinimarinibacterium thermocellulolyticum TaxID=3170016 RepID=A0ABV2A7M2_9GAMM